MKISKNVEWDVKKFFVGLGWVLVFLLIAGFVGLLIDVVTGK